MAKPKHGDLHHELSVLIAPHLSDDPTSNAGLFYNLALSLLHMATEAAVAAAGQLARKQKKTAPTFDQMALLYITSAYHRVVAGERTLKRRKKPVRHSRPHRQ